MTALFNLSSYITAAIFSLSPRGSERKKEEERELLVCNDTREIRTRASEETRTLPWRLRPTRPEYPIPGCFLEYRSYISLTLGCLLELCIGELRAINNFFEFSNNNIF